MGPLLLELQVLDFNGELLEGLETFLTGRRQGAVKGRKDYF